MSEKKIVLLSNISWVFDEVDNIDDFRESFIKEEMTSDENHIKELFSKEDFVVSIINDDNFSESCFSFLVKALNDTNFPAIIIASKSNIKKYSGLLPITVDFLENPASRFELYLHYNRIIEIYKMNEKLSYYKSLEDELDVRENLMELSRQEIINSSETIKALEATVDLSRQELMRQKEEIEARDQILEHIRKNKIDMLSSIKAFESVLRYADQEKMFYEKEIGALENLLAYIVEEYKEKKKR